MFKKFKGMFVAVVAVVVLLAIPNYSSAATLASYTATISNSGQMTGNYNSNGGTYKVCVSNIRSGNKIRVQLFESDPNTALQEIGSDKFIYSSSGCATWTGIATDGTYAELNAKLNSYTGDDTVYVQLID